MAADKRARVWSFIGYPEDSLPENYAAVLSDELHLCWAESPVHDADLNGDGSEKKKHIHFILAFEGMKSFEQVQEITDKLHCPIPQKCRNARALVRYFIHLDNPDKHQYREEDIKCHGGFEIDEYFKKSNAQLRDVLKEILAFCVDNEISEFCDLVEAVFQQNNDEWIDIITNRNTVFLASYLKSKHFVAKERAALEEYEAAVDISKQVAKFEKMVRENNPGISEEEVQERINEYKTGIKRGGKAFESGFSGGVRSPG